MKVKCTDCKREFENDRDYPTSICNDCFYKFLKEKIQPLRDEIEELKRTRVDKSVIDKLDKVFYSAPQPSKLIERWEEAKNED